MEYLPKIEQRTIISWYVVLSSADYFRYDPRFLLRFTSGLRACSILVTSLFTCMAIYLALESILTNAFLVCFALPSLESAVLFTFLFCVCSCPVLCFALIYFGFVCSLLGIISTKTLPCRLVMLSNCAKILLNWHTCTILVYLLQSNIPRVQATKIIYMYVPAKLTLAWICASTEITLALITLP